MVRVLFLCKVFAQIAQEQEKQIVLSVQEKEEIFVRHVMVKAILNNI